MGRHSPFGQSQPIIRLCLTVIRCLAVIRSGLLIIASFAVVWAGPLSPALASYDDALAAIRGQDDDQPDYARGERLLRSCAWQDDDLFCQNALGRLYRHGVFPNGAKRPRGAAETAQIEAYVWYFLAASNPSFGSDYAPIQREVRGIRQSARYECRVLHRMIGLPLPPRQSLPAACQAMTDPMVRNDCAATDAQRNACASHKTDEAQTACLAAVEAANEAAFQAAQQAFQTDTALAAIRRRLEYILYSRGASGFIRLGQLYLADTKLKGADQRTQMLSERVAETRTAIAALRTIIRDELSLVLGRISQEHFMSMLLATGSGRRTDLIPFFDLQLDRYSRMVDAVDGRQRYLDALAAMIDTHLDETDLSRTASEAAGRDPERAPGSVAVLLETLLTDAHERRRARERAEREKWEERESDRARDDDDGEDGGPSRDATIRAKDVDDAFEDLAIFLETLDEGRRRILSPVAAADLRAAQDAVALIRNVVTGSDLLDRLRQSDVDDLANIAGKLSFIFQRMDMMTAVLDDIDASLAQFTAFSVTNSAPACMSPFPPDVAKAYRYFNKADTYGYPASDQMVDLLQDQDDLRADIDGAAFQDVEPLDWLYPPRRRIAANSAVAQPEDEPPYAYQYDPDAPWPPPFSDETIRLPEREHELARLAAKIPETADFLNTALRHLGFTGANGRQRFQASLGAPVTGTLATWEQVKLLQLAARRGHAESSLWLGKFYFEAAGVRRSYRLAHDLFRQAANTEPDTDKSATSAVRGEAACYMHLLLSRDLVFPKDDAAIWAEQARAAGLAAAMKKSDACKAIFE